MTKKIRVGILFGGVSAEHEISLQSAANVIGALDKSKYELTLISIDKKGGWYVSDESEYLLNIKNPKLTKLKQSDKPLAFIPGNSEQQFISTNEAHLPIELDVIFPVLHGPYGEDGTIQGLLKLANIAFVGSCVLGSALCMDKDISKRLFEHAGLPVCKYLVYRKADAHTLTFDKIKDKLGENFFIKPANMGSSLGVSKITSIDEFQQAVDLAFSYDNKIIFEQAVVGKELEVSVLGDNSPTASTVGEIVTKTDFYSYQTKYLDDSSASLKIPANIDHKTSEKIKQLAIKAFKALECKDMARCDFFLSDDGKLFINEINSIPGFTHISMYPKLWEASGISYTDLLDRLINFAIARHSS
jgi:D-alanine-D-alanine ligase